MSRESGDVRTSMRLWSRADAPDEARPRPRMAPVIAAFVALMVVAPAHAKLKGRDTFKPGQPPASLYLRQTVVMNDGHYALVDSASGYDKNKDKSAEATCPGGMKAMSAGFSAASSRGEPPDFRLILSKPNDKGTGWKVFGMFDGSGNVGPNGVVGVPAPFDWELRIRLVCAKL